MRVYNADGAGRKLNRRPEYRGDKERDEGKQRRTANSIYEGGKLRPKLKYLVVGGLVRSQTDSQLHRVIARELARLYRVDPRECIFCEDDDEARYNLLGVEPGRLIVLRPRADGVYRSPRAAGRP